ncbi:MAG: hypothetical protein AAGB11_09565 [Pseudomonadota bacterium]
MLRLLKAATLLSLGTVAFLALAVPRLYTGYEERAVRAELQAATEGENLDRVARQAIEDGDISAALQFAAIASDLGKPLSPDTLNALTQAQGTFATALRNATDFAGAYITGNADNAAGLAGAVISDLTVVGDVRDIVSEGGKAAVGEEYSRFLLALAAVGLAAEGATIATGGTSLVFKAAVSVLKVAKRTGNLTVGFSAHLLRLTRAAARSGPDAGPAGALAAAPIRPGAARAAPVSGRATPPLTRAAARAELRATFGAVNTLAQNAGPANAVKLMRFVRTTRDAQDLATMSTRFGRRTRAVVELTGKTALRGFRVIARGMRLLIAFLWGLLAWLAGLIAIKLVRAALGGGYRLLRGAILSVP